MAEIVRPSWPGPDDSEFYKYLGSAGVDKSILQDCCIKEAKVIGVTSRESVRLLLDEVEYDNVPVWINTDIGSRTSAVTEQEEFLPSDYFKDAGLMFPFPMGINTTGGITVTPTVLVAVYKDLELDTLQCLAVIHILTNVFSRLQDIMHPTYRMYIRLDLDYKFLSVRQLKETYLYDLLEDRIVTIPSIVDGVVSLPFFDADEIKTYSIDGLEPDEEEKALALDVFLSSAITADEEFLQAGVPLDIGSRPFTWFATPVACDVYTDGPFKPVFVETLNPGGSYTGVAGGEYEEIYYCYEGYRSGDGTGNKSSAFTVIDGLYNEAQLIDIPIRTNHSILPISGYMGFSSNWGIYLETSFNSEQSVSTGGSNLVENATQKITMTYGPGIASEELIFNYSGSSEITIEGTYPNQTQYSTVITDQVNHQIIHAKSSGGNFFCDLKWIDLITTVKTTTDIGVYSYGNSPPHDISFELSLLNNTSSAYITPTSLVTESGFSTYFHDVFADVLDKIKDKVDMGYAVDDVFPATKVTIYFKEYDIQEGLL